MARFLLDVMCGGLRVPLRMCGHDTVYALDRGLEADERLLALAEAEDRRLVTRDRDLAARTDGTVLLSAHDVADQLAELRAAGVALSLAETPTYCGRCNGPLAPLAGEDARPAYVPEAADDVWRCRSCGQCFWKGSHWDDVRETLAEV